MRATSLFLSVYVAFSVSSAVRAGENGNGAKLANPLPGATASGKFGERYYLNYVRQGIGLAVIGVEEADVLAAAAGEVVFAGDDKRHDTQVVIRHNGIAGVAETKYSFLRKAIVAKGQKVARGEKIATVAVHYGWVNRRFPPKLIFEVRGPNGKPVDPCGFIACRYEAKKDVAKNNEAKAKKK
jgi:murein DD-endopeptidase MepM/ murein hydrolase activator NlpD